MEGLAAGLKAMSTWHATETIQTCREACGGAGYLAENRLGTLKADTDVFTRHLLDALARRLKRGIDEGGDPFQAFLAVQDHAVSTARAHVERLVLEHFSAAIARVRKKGVAETMDLLCDLYALDRIERDRGWFQEHGRLSATRSKAVIRTVTELCREVRGDAEDLVEAFAIPDRLLAAPIAID